MQPFRPRAGQTIKDYYEVPIDIIEDAQQLIAWARQALRAGAALTGGARGTGRRRNRQSNEK